jgi:hypothetical protein
VIKKMLLIASVGFMVTTGIAHADNDCTNYGAKDLSPNLTTDTNTDQAITTPVVNKG